MHTREQNEWNDKVNDISLCFTRDISSEKKEKELRGEAT